MNMQVNGGTHGGFFGGDNNGSIVVNSSAEPEPQPFNVRQTRLLPITERGLNVLAAIVTLFMAVGGWKSIERATDELTMNGSADSSLHAVWSGLLPVYVVLAGAVVLSLVVVIRRRIRTRTMGFPVWDALPVVAGTADGRGRGRLAMLRLAGICQARFGHGECGGKLRFYNKATAWTERRRPNGTVKRVVTERTPVAECRRNVRHVYQIDVADVS